MLGWPVPAQPDVARAALAAAELRTGERHRSVGADTRGISPAEAPMRAGTRRELTEPLHRDPVATGASSKLDESLTTDAARRGSRSPSQGRLARRHQDALSLLAAAASVGGQMLREDHNAPVRVDVTERTARASTAWSLPRVRLSQMSLYGERLPRTVADTL
jgi:hypothetical protein